MRAQTQHPSSPDRHGFTLIELLVVMAVVTTLAAILFPVFARAKQAARATQCLVQLKQIGIAWQLYLPDADEVACPSYYYSPDFGTEYAWDFSTSWSAAGSSTHAGLLQPYLRSTTIHGCTAFQGQAWNRPHTGYGYNASYVGGDPFAGIPAATASQISDPSGTVLLADAGYGDPVAACNFLRAPSDALFVAGTVHFRHRGRASAIWADGHATSAQPLNPDAQTGALSRNDEAYDLQ